MRAWEDGVSEWSNIKMIHDRSISNGLSAVQVFLNYNQGICISSCCCLMWPGIHLCVHNLIASTLISISVTVTSINRGTGVHYVM